MEFDYTTTQHEMRAAVRGLCVKFGDEYWRKLDEEGAYPEAFVQAMTGTGRRCKASISWPQRPNSAR